MNPLVMTSSTKMLEIVESNSNQLIFDPKNRVFFVLLVGHYLLGGHSAEWTITN